MHDAFKKRNLLANCQPFPGNNGRENVIDLMANVRLWRGTEIVSVG